MNNWLSSSSLILQNNNQKNWAASRKINFKTTALEKYEIWFYNETSSIIICVKYLRIIVRILFSVYFQVWVLWHAKCLFFRVFICLCSGVIFDFIVMSLQFFWWEFNVLFKVQVLDFRQNNFDIHVLPFESWYIKAL